MFVIPWRDHTLIGSSHVEWHRAPDDFEVTEADLQGLLDEINESYPGVEIDRGDVSFVNAGLVPMEESGNGSTDVKLGRRHRIIDHAVENGLEGLISVVGIRYTTARAVAERAIDLVLRRLDRKPQKCVTATTPIHGGDIEDFSAFVTQATRDGPSELSGDVMDHLLHTYGSEYRDVLKLADDDACLGETISNSSVLKAGITHAVQTEMAQNLGDVVFRRTGLGTVGNPGTAALEECAALMAAELKWSKARMRKEIDEVVQVFP